MKYLPLALAGAAAVAAYFFLRPSKQEPSDLTGLTPEQLADAAKNKPKKSDTPISDIFEGK